MSLRSLSTSALLLGLTLGCGSTPKSSFYLLSTPDAPEVEVEGPIVVVGPVLLPEYVARPEIVTRTDDHRLDVPDFERWAEPLEGAFSRALVLGIAGGLPSTRVVEQSWEVPDDPEEVVHRVAVTVTRFDTDAAGVACLDARWALGTLEGLEAPVIGRASLRSEPAGDDTAARVRALSGLVAELAERIAVELTSAD